MYKLNYNIETRQLSKAVMRTTDNAAIPFAPDNTDYQQFKRDIQNGVELLDANASPVTGAALTTFIGTLP